MDFAGLLYDQFRLSRVISREGFVAGLQELEAAVLRLSLDAHLAVTECIPFDEAAADEARFPFLHRLHCAVSDALLMDVPDEIATWLRNLRNAPTRR